MLWGRRRINITSGSSTPLFCEYIDSENRNEYGDGKDDSLSGAHIGKFVEIKAPS